MSAKGNYTVGYGKPPENGKFKKNQSGNPAGRPPKPPPTWAQIIEIEWAKPIILITKESKTYLGLILHSLVKETGSGNKRAARIFKRYQEHFRKKLLKAYEDMPAATDMAPPVRHKRYKPGPDAPLSEKEKKYRKWEKEVDMICPEGMSVMDLPLDEAKKLFHLLQKAPERPTSRDPWRRRRAKKLEGTEILDEVLNAPITVTQGRRRSRLPRMAGMIKQLVVTAAKGDLGSAEVLIGLLTDSTVNGDFGIPKRLRK